MTNTHTPIDDRAAGVSVCPVVEAGRACGFPLDRCGHASKKGPCAGQSCWLHGPSGHRHECGCNCAQRPSFADEMNGATVTSCPTHGLPSKVTRATTWTTYRRADGELISGEFGFVTSLDSWDWCDDPVELVREKWVLIDRQHVTIGVSEIDDEAVTS